MHRCEVPETKIQSQLYYDCLDDPGEANQLLRNSFLMGFKAHRPARPPMSPDPRSLTFSGPPFPILIFKIKGGMVVNYITYPPRILQGLNNTMYVKCLIQCLTHNMINNSSCYNYG